MEGVGVGGVVVVVVISFDRDVREPLSVRFHLFLEGTLNQIHFYINCQFLSIFYVPDTMLDVLFMLS